MAWTAPRTWVTGETVTAALMNTHIKDNLLAIGEHVKVVKSADESVTSSTTLQDDDELLFAVAANETWLYRFGIFATGNTTGEFKYKINGPTSHAMRYGHGGAMEDTSATVSMLRAGRDDIDIQPINVQTTPTAIMLQLDGIIANAGNAGNCTLRWAQNTSDGTATVVEQNSYLIATQVN